MGSNYEIITYGNSPYFHGLYWLPITFSYTLCNTFLTNIDFPIP